MSDYKQQARERFPYSTIHGSGPYCVVRKCHPRWQCFLYQTRQRAEIALARRGAQFIVELDTPYVPDNRPLAPASGIDWGRD